MNDKDKNQGLTPHIIQLPSIGDESIGFISILESPQLPFSVKRVYWTYYTPSGTRRGNHAHKELHQLISAVSGIIKISLESVNGKRYSFTLDNPSKALYVPPGYWRIIEMREGTVLLCMASERFDEKDYIRNYNKFKSGTENNE